MCVWGYVRMITVNSRLERVKIIEIGETSYLELVIRLTFPLALWTQNKPSKWQIATVFHMLRLQPKHDKVWMKPFIH